MNPDIPALSLRQPWLWAILNCGKMVENRSWATPYRGRIRLHASKTWDEEGVAFVHAAAGKILDEGEFHRSGWMGVYMGEITIVDCLPWSFSLRDEHRPWAFGPVCWILADPAAYEEPIPGRGYPRLFYPEKRPR